MVNLIDMKLLLPVPEPLAIFNEMSHAFQNESLIPNKMECSLVELLMEIPNGDVISSFALRQGIVRSLNNWNKDRKLSIDKLLKLNASISRLYLSCCLQVIDAQWIHRQPIHNLFRLMQLNEFGSVLPSVIMQVCLDQFSYIQTLSATICANCRPRVHLLVKGIWEKKESCNFQRMQDCALAIKRYHCYLELQKKHPLFKS